jgi:hypothetical protein
VRRRMWAAPEPAIGVLHECQLAGRRTHDSVPARYRRHYRPKFSGRFTMRRITDFFVLCHDSGAQATRPSPVHWSLELLNHKKI